MDRRVQKAFDDLKKQFTEEPVLMMLDQTRPFKMKPMHQSTQQEQFSPSWMQMAIDTQFPLSQKHSHQQNKSMKSTIVNYWQLLEHWKNGDIIFKDRHTPQLFYQIKRT